MKKLVLVLAAVCAAYALQAAPDRPLEPQGAAPASSVAAWEQRAQGVTIIRDTWGIPHVYGKTDADAVFGVIYAQAEDDFNRVETNFLNSMGRLAEAEGESADLPRPADEALHRPGRDQGAVREEPGVAEGADERVGRRPQLLPAHPSRR